MFGRDAARHVVAVVARAVEHADRAHVRDDAPAVVRQPRSRRSRGMRAPACDALAPYG